MVWIMLICIVCMPMYCIKVACLEARLKSLYEQSAADVEAKDREGRVAAAELEKELAGERRRHAAAVEELQSKHQLEEARVREKGAATLHSLEEQLQTAHRTDVHTIREADRIAADALRGKLDREKAEALKQAGERHKGDLGGAHGLVTMVTCHCFIVLCLCGVCGYVPTLYIRMWLCVDNTLCVTLYVGRVCVCTVCGVMCFGDGVLFMLTCDGLSLVQSA